MAHITLPSADTSTCTSGDATFSHLTPVHPMSVDSARVSQISEAVHFECSSYHQRYFHTLMTGSEVDVSTFAPLPSNPPHFVNITKTTLCFPICNLTRECACAHSSLCMGIDCFTPYTLTNVRTTTTRTPQSNLKNTCSALCRWLHTPLLLNTVGYKLRYPFTELFIRCTFVNLVWNDVEPDARLFISS